LLCKSLKLTLTKKEEVSMNKEMMASERTFLSSKLSGRKIYSAKEGILLGSVRDLMIDLNLLEVAAIVTTEGDLVKRDLSYIPSGEVLLWGQDMILVNQVDVILAREDMPDCDKWVSVSDDLTGMRIMTTSGEQLGEIKDLIIGGQGRIEGYVSNKPEDLPKALRRSDGENVYIPILATHSLGSEMLIINPRNLTENSEPAD